MQSLRLLCVGFCRNRFVTSSLAIMAMLTNSNASSVGQTVDAPREAIDAPRKVRVLETSSPGPFIQERSGRLLLCGGNKLPKSVLDWFFQAGGAEQGCLVIIPTASPQSDAGDFSRWISMWKDYRWQKVSILHANASDAAKKPEWIEMLKNASAVWIPGGNQQRLVDRYSSTDVLVELRSLLARGGVVGGTSAGAAIASKVMIAGGLTEPRTQEGWGLLPNLIVDQHFSQRGRFERLRNAVQENPTQMGLGIDEATAVLITEGRMQVMGNGAAYLFGAGGLPSDMQNSGPFHSSRLQHGDVVVPTMPSQE